MPFFLRNHVHRSRLIKNQLLIDNSIKVLSINKLICEQKGIDFIPNLISKKFFQVSLKTKRDYIVTSSVNWSNKWKGLELLKAIINDPKMQKFNFVLIGKNLSYSDFKTKNVRIFDLVDNFNEYVNLISKSKLF